VLDAEPFFSFSVFSGGDLLRGQVLSRLTAPAEAAVSPAPSRDQTHVGAAIP